MKFEQLPKDAQGSIVVYYADYFGIKRLMDDQQLHKEIFTRQYNCNIYKRAIRSNDFEDWHEHIIDGSKTAQRD